MSVKAQARLKPSFQSPRSPTSDKSFYINSLLSWWYMHRIWIFIWNNWTHTLQLPSCCILARQQLLPLLAPSRHLGNIYKCNSIMEGHPRSHKVRLNTVGSGQYSGSKITGFSMEGKRLQAKPAFSSYDLRFFGRLKFLFNLTPIHLDSYQDITLGISPSIQ